ncbi:MAG: hypothetical protein FD546_000218 [Pelagibacterales bacterium]|nr:hypothetical protein [Pelagibacterales bacterium]
MIKKNLFKVILINLLIFFIIISSIIIFPPFILDGYKSLKNNILSNVSKTVDTRAKLINYKNYDWAEKHFDELNKLSTKYYDYIGWRRNEFKGQTININEMGYRKNSKKNNTINPVKNEAWFFGGSAIWGTGSPDDKTIPAIFEEFSDLTSTNFGESGYTTQQNLNLLIKNYIIGGKPKVVFFYDGVNDISYKCRKELDFFSSGRERYIRDQLEKSNLSKLVGPTKDLFKILLNKFNLKNNNFYDCDTNPKKSNLIVENFIMNWEIAKNIVESNGGIFYPILQPMGYIGEPNVSHLKLNSNSGTGSQINQFLFMYDKIQNKLREKNLNYIDLTKIFNNNEYYYIDFVHVSPDGNKKIAKSIFEKIKIEN